MTGRGFGDFGPQSQTFSEPSYVDSPLSPDFTPDSLEADKCSVRLYIGKGTAFLYGTLIRSFLHLKENLFGEDQQFTAMASEYSAQRGGGGGGGSKADKGKGSAGHAQPTAAQPPDGAEVWDPRPYRPIEVILDLSVNNLVAHLIKNCSKEDLTCPFLVVEQIGFEMDKKFRETKLQLILSPVLLRSGALSSKQRTDGDGLLSQGHLLLTGLQFRGHGMFSELDRPLGADTVEYAWLIEVRHKFSQPPLRNSSTTTYICFLGIPHPPSLVGILYGCSLWMVPELSMSS